MADIKQQEVLALLSTLVDIQPLKDIAQAMELTITNVESRKGFYRLVANHINSDAFEGIDISERYSYLANARITIQAYMDEKAEEEEEKLKNEREAERKAERKEQRKRTEEEEHRRKE